MLSCFLLGMSSLRVAVPAITLFGSAPTFFTLWVLVRSITLIFFPHHIYRRCDDYLFSIYQRSVLFFFENWVNVKIYFHGDYEEIFKQKENVLYLSNHQSSVDWIIANMLAIRQGSLGHIRYVLKSDLKWTPLYGFYFQQHGCIYAPGNDKEDLERVEKRIGHIKYNGLPIWLVLFPEGTRFNPVRNQDVIERARLFAQQQGVPPLDYVLYPRSDTTVAAINALKDKLDAVYDITIMYSQTYDDDQQIRLAAPSLTEYLQGRTSELHIHIKRIPIDAIPSETNEQISHWLHQRFTIKDKLLNRFYNTYRNKTDILDIYSSREVIQDQLGLNRTIYSSIFFLLTTFSLLSTSQGRSFYWKIWLFGTPLSFLWMYLLPPK